MRIGGKEFDLEHHFYVMGILNTTPDSFSDGGSYEDVERAVCHARQMEKDGAAIIDVGGESARPGFVRISVEEEIHRVCPVIERLKRELDVPVCLDTYKADVARAGISAGADMINDIWGLHWEESLAEVIAEADIPCCLMHNRQDTDYSDFVEDVRRELVESVELARAAGIREENIVLDPGIGFAKDTRLNLLLMKNLHRIVELGYPVLLGVSRKSVIGQTLDLPVNEREEGTIATSVLGRMAGCSIFRVHDVEKNVRALRMAEAVLRAEG